MSERKRINLSVPEGMYEILQLEATRYGFDSVCSLVLSCTRIVLNALAERRRDQPAEAEDDDRFIRRMFDELADADSPPFARGAPVRRRHRKAAD